MKNNLLFCIMITFLIICSALFARHCTEHRDNDEALPVMAYDGRKKTQSGITFSDLAETVSFIVNGEVAA